VSLPREAPAPAADPGAGASTTPDGFPDLDAFRGRLGVHSWQDPADEADAAGALDAAVDYVVERSTRYRRLGVTPAVYRGTLDLAVSLYERRGSNVDPFDGLTPAQRTSFHRLLGISRHAHPFIGGA
jgi:hypothetical protein